MTQVARVSAPETSWTGQQRRQRRREYERNHKATYGSGIREQSHEAQMVIPSNIVVHQRDPAPCFRCGVNGGCKHRPWEGEYV